MKSRSSVIVAILEAKKQLASWDILLKYIQDWQQDSDCPTSDEQVWPYSGEDLMLRKQMETYAQLPAACTVSCVVLAVFDLTENRAEAAPGESVTHPAPGRHSRVITAHSVSFLFCCVSCWARGFFLNQTDSRYLLIGLVWSVTSAEDACKISEGALGVKPSGIFQAWNNVCIKSKM